jgi:putative tricarboxylic transport membrane protein
MRKLHRAGARGTLLRLGALGIGAVIAAACTGGGGGSPAAASYPEKDVSIMAPADPGGGWDSTARAMQQALESGVTDKSVEVYNVGGAGGTVGLAEFVETKKGDPHQLMVMGLVMVGAIRI